MSLLLTRKQRAKISADNGLAALTERKKLGMNMSDFQERKSFEAATSRIAATIEEAAQPKLKKRKIKWPF